MPKNNENGEPSMEECAASVARLAEHVELLDPLILRPFVKAVMKKVDMARVAQAVVEGAEAQEGAVMLKKSGYYGGSVTQFVE